jgi:two-component system sensor histidine kinase ChiS
MFTILLVDDHKHLVESMATTIPWEQYEIHQVYRAYSGQEALDIVAKHAIDMIITDIRMPVMSGLELIEHIREAYSHIDCILLTGFADFQYAQRAIQLQAVSYLLKPVRDEELLVSIRGIIAKRKKQRSEQDQLIKLKSQLLQVRTEAELSIKEERSRIAYDIHDIVGHTLTTTLVQIEAAKRLIQRNNPEGILRLEQSQELVRKSMHDIREAVHVMKWQDDQVDLENYLKTFVAEVEHAADIMVDLSIELPGPVSNSIYKKAIYHSLQEGITNGIRHGRGRFFRFRLFVVEGGLCFLLWNNGIPYDGKTMGFGLNAMLERVQSAGGTLELKATKEPEGTLLTIQFPIPMGAKEMNDV